jgi:hypothetical protein
MFFIEHLSTIERVKERRDGKRRLQRIRSNKVSPLLIDPLAQRGSEGVDNGGIGDLTTRREQCNEARRAPARRLNRNNGRRHAAMRIALRKQATPLDLSKRVASAGGAGWLRQEMISALFEGMRV